MRSISFIAAALLALQACSLEAEPPTSTLILGAEIYDGTGTDAIDAAVRIDGDRIIDVGNLAPLRGETVIDAAGLVLVPGFIDSHSHHDSGIAEFRDVPGALSQGVTTIVRGHDGFSDVDNEIAYVPQAEFNLAFTANPAAINVASYSPHNSIRHQVMGSDYRRNATTEEIASMSKLIEADMRAGAIGLSTGLEYEPGIFSSTEEVIRLARVAADLRGTYSSHIRDEDDQVKMAIDEVIRIGREANIPVIVSHIKLADREFWGTTDEVLAKLDNARAQGIDIRTDLYPYERWASNLAILFPDRNYSNRAAAEFTFEHTARPDDIVLVHYPPNPEFEGLNIEEIADFSGRDPESTLMTLAQDAEDYRRETGKTGARIVARGMNETDVVAFAKWPLTSFCSDGGPTISHPRSYGAFPRVIRRFVKELEILTLQEAIYKMTGLPADTLQLSDRGRIKPGMYADIVLFDLVEISDHATMEDPTARSTGIKTVWVNGVVAFSDGEPTRRYPGRLVSLAD